MEKEEITFQNLVAAMRTKVPHKAILTKRLADILSIEREAVYRRMRGEVPFTLNELAAISGALDLSIDDVISGGLSNIKQFNTHLDLDDEHEAHLHYFYQLNRAVNVLENVECQEHSELCCSSNMLPQGIYFNYEPLAKFFLFKWIYQQEEVNKVSTFKDVEIPEDMMEMQRRYMERVLCIKEVSLIWDFMIFQYLVNDIRYFEKIKLLKRDDVETIKASIFQLLDNLESIAAAGTYEGINKISFYISNINFDTNYCYLETEMAHISVIQTFTLNLVTSSDAVIFEKMKGWIQRLKRFSALISESGDIQRVQFFEKQRQLVEAL
jgi:hypothetical protein